MALHAQIVGLSTQQLLVLAAMRLMANRTTLVENRRVLMFFCRASFGQVCMAGKTGAYRTLAKQAGRIGCVRAMAADAAVVHVGGHVLHLRLRKSLLHVAVTSEAKSPTRPFHELDLVAGGSGVAGITAGCKGRVHHIVEELRRIRSVRVVTLRTVAFFDRLVLMGFLQRWHIAAVAIKAKSRHGAIQVVDTLRLRRWFALVRGVTCAAAHVHRCMLCRLCQDFRDGGVATKAKIACRIPALRSALQQSRSG